MIEEPEVGERLDNLEKRIAALEDFRERYYETLKSDRKLLDLFCRRNEWIRDAPTEELEKVNKSKGNWWPEHLRE